MVKQKRIISLLMTVIIFLSQFPVLPVSAAGDENYVRKYIDFPILNMKTREGYAEYFKQSNNDSVFNVTGWFRRDYLRELVRGKYSYAPENLSFNEFTTGGNYEAGYTMGFGEAARRIANKGDLEVAYTADFTNAYHWSIYHYWEYRTNYGESILGSAPSSYKYLGNVLHSYSSEGHDIDGTITRENTVKPFAAVGTGTFSSLGLNLTNRGLGCAYEGASRISNMGVAIADVKGPKVERVYTTRLPEPDSPEFTQFHDGETIYIHMKFDEYIRFAEDAITYTEVKKEGENRVETKYNIKDKMKLIISISDIETKQSLDDTIEAEWVSLKDDTLTFRYTDPIDSGSNDITNFYMNKVIYDLQDSWIEKNGAEIKDIYKLSFVYKESSDGLVKTVELNDKARKADLDLVSSLVTDLAGNPVCTAVNGANFNKPCYMDSAEPYVKKISVFHVEKKPNNGIYLNLSTNPENNTDTGSIYMTPGEKIGLSVFFNEEMLFNRNGAYTPIDETNISKLRADLNLTDGGSTITLQPLKITAENDGANGSLISRLYFEFIIPENAKPVRYDGDEWRPLGINRIYSTDGDYVLSDTRGNTYDVVELINTEPSKRKMPAEELWLDSVKPELVTTISEAGGKYKPLSHEPGGNPSEFYFPIEISDGADSEAGPDYISGTEGVKGTIRWENAEAKAYPFEYYIGGTAVPENARYKTASAGESFTFDQIGGGDGNVIHIRMIDGLEYSVLDTGLAICVMDHAGNTREYSFPLDYIYDNIGPAITREKYLTTYDSSIETGKITVEIGIRDIKEMADSVWYQWVGEYSELLPEEWTDITAGNTGTGQFKRFSLDLTDMETDINHMYDLYIRTLNNDNTETVKVLDCDYDLTKPKYRLEFVTNPDELLSKHIVIFSEPYNETVTGGVYEGNTAIAMIKIEDTENEYWVKNTLMPTNADLGDSKNIEDIFDIPDTDDLEQYCDEGNDPADYFTYWNRCTVTENEDNSIVIEREEDIARLPAFPLVTEEQRRLSNHLNNTYYGSMKVRFIAAYKEELEVTGTGNDAKIVIPNTANYADMEYSFNFANDISGAVHKVTFETITSDGNPESDDNLATDFNRSYTLEGLLDNRPQLLRSLEGVNIRVNIENILVPEYGISDIDFESEYTYFQLIYNGTHNSPEDWGWASVYKIPLAAASSQVIQIPAGAALQPGHYYAGVCIDRKSAPGVNSILGCDDYGSTIDEPRDDGSTGICIDNQIMEDYGVSKVSSNAAVTAYGLSQGTKTSEICLNSIEDIEVTFKAGYTPLMLGRTEGGTDIYTRAYVNVWNEAAGTETGWRELSGSGEYIFASDELIELAGESGILSYRFMASSADKKITADEGGNITTEFIPYMTPVQTLLVRMSDEGPALEMSFNPTTATNGDVIARVSRLESGNSAPEALTLLYGRQGEAGTAFVPGQEIIISENGSYFFKACDMYHNFTIIQKEIDWIDKTAPTLSVQDNSAGNKFSFTAEITDENAGNLFISFDKEYGSLLGYETGEGEDPPVFKVSEAENGTWIAKSASDIGTYRTVSAAAGGVKTVTFEGVFKFDKSKAEEAVISRTIRLHASDIAGNISDVREFTIPAANTKTKYITCAYEEGGIEAVFTAPVILTSPGEGSPVPSYSTEKSGVPIFANGSYTIGYTDIFGEDYEENIAVDAYTAINNVTVLISETAPTNRNVIVTIDASGNPDITLGLPASDGNMAVEPVIIDEEVKGALIAVSSNCVISFDILPDAGGSIPRRIAVDNIDKDAPTATLSWVYSAPLEANGETKGEVTVSLAAGEAVKGTNGKTTSHVFTLNDQEEYTFEYCDLAGNPGTPVTADLRALVPAVTIVEKTLQELDTDSPEYYMSVFRNISGSLINVAGYSKSQYDALVINPFDDPLYVTSAMKLDFNITDINQTKLLLFNGIRSEADMAGIVYGSNGETVNGASPGGNSVYINENGSFTVVIIDANNNKTLVPVEIARIDKVHPEGEITYISVGFEAVRAYIVLTDDISASGDIRMLSAVGVIWDAAYNGTGAYYHEFKSNGAFIFTFEDEAGNVGTASAEVGSIDEEAPAVISEKWSPCFIDSAGGAVQNRPTMAHTNKNVTVYIEFNKNVKDIAAAVIDANGTPVPGAVPGKYFELSAGAADATIGFKQGARLRLSFTALNGRSGTHVLHVENIIDKKVPDISVESSEPAGSFVQQVSLTFKSDEKVYSLDNGAEFSMSGINEYVHTATVNENGDYKFRFVDKAGNVTVKELSITKIDNTGPVITVTGIPKTKDEAGHASQRETVKVKVKINEAGKLIFGETDFNVNAGEEKEFEIKVNGRHSITAEDEVKNKTYTSFVVDCIDTLAPVITFTKSVLKAEQGTMVAAFEAAAMEGVYAADDYDEDMTGKYSLTGSLTQEQLNSPGSYSIIYTAGDSAGNTRTAARIVKVYSMDQPTIFANGEKTDSGETLFLPTDEISLRVSIPDNGMGTEPYKLFCGKGRLTPGQIKSRGTRLAVEDNKASFKALEEGFYTICLVTQSRETYITYIYSMK